jgi:hypothetical protein
VAAAPVVVPAVAAAPVAPVVVPAAAAVAAAVVAVAVAVSAVAVARFGKWTSSHRRQRCFRRRTPQQSE